MKPLVSIIMGSTSDLPVMEKACKWLNDNQIPFEVNALSAHRTPDAVESFAKGAKERGVKETFEKNWEPLESEPSLTPVKLIIILDLYFQLTPITMVPETPEIIDLGKLIRTSPKVIAEAMGVFMYCDPYLNREDVLIHPLLEACSDIWHQYGNGNPDRLYQLANELKEYFK
jgi:hypothetical protein